MIRLPGRAAVCLCLLLGAGLRPAAGAEAPRRPSLVVVIVGDQISAGTLERIRGLLSGGFRRFLDRGRRFERCSHDHAVSETGPGHAVLMSGLHPSRNGIITNDWHDPVQRRDVYCVGDLRPEAAPGFDGGPAVTAALLRGENLADLIKRASPGSKVYAVAGKDRSSILSAGHRPDGAFWYSVTTGGFTSHPGIVSALPAWGAPFWSGEPLESAFFREGIPGEWTYPIRAQAMPDDYPFEWSAFSRAAPHPIWKPDPRGETAAKRTEALARRIQGSPWMDWLTLKLAERILDGEALGRDGAADLLVVSLSGIDYVGHYYGPGSQEFLDHLIRVDGWLGALMRRADEAAGGGALFALSADHATLPIPETMPGARRIDMENLRRRVEDGLSARLGEDGVPARGPFIESEQSGNIYLDRSTLDRLGVPLARAIEETRRELLGNWEIARVYRRSDLTAAPAGADPFLDLYRNAFDPERSGDLVVQPCEKCLFTSRAEGTSHGSPYAYDRLVPMYFLGPGVKPGADSGACSTVDLAPTLADRLGMTFESPRDGKILLKQQAVDRAPVAQ